MSIELKQAAQDAAEAIDWLLKNIQLDAPHLSGKAMGNAEKCASALRTAIQQNEARTAVRCEGCGYMTHHREHMGCVRAAKQFTHLAPGVPGDVVRDAQRYRWLRKWKGQEHEPPFTVQHEFDGTIWGGDLDSAIDAAMLAAQAKGGT